MPASAACATAQQEGIEMLDPDRKGPRVVVRIVPPGKTLSMPRPKTARQLLAALGMMEEDALVARGGRLLTPDRQIWPDDVLFVRVVASSG